MPTKDDGGIAIEARDVEKTEEYCRRKEAAVLAIVFTDIARSTDLREELGEISYEELRETHDSALDHIIATDGAGAVIKSTGDGILAVFSEPSTAVERSLRVQHHFRSHTHFRLRIGVDMGQVSKHSMGGVIQDVFGRHVNRAARIEAKAEPGHVLVSFNVYDCAVNWLRSTPIAWTHHGQVYLKGFAEPVSLHEPFEPGITSPQAGGVRLPTLLESLEQTLGADDTVTRDDKAAHTPMAAPDPLDVWFVNDPSIRRLGGAIARAIRQRRTGGGSVLWVDDHPENNVPLVSILERAGCSVECATSTEAAGRRLRTRQYSVIITDMGRGDDATAGLKLLAFREAHGIETPTIIYASSQAIANHGPKARELGAARCTAGAVSLIQHIHDAIAYPITFGREEWGAGQE